jgi:hypothetical protein
VSPGTDETPSIRHRVLTAGVLLGSLAMLVYGVGRLTETISWQAPASVYFVFAIGLFAWALYLVRRT